MQRFLIYLFLQTLYMFQAVPAPMVRGTNLDLFISTDALHVSGGSSTHHQGHISWFISTDALHVSGGSSTHHEGHISWFLYFYRRSTCFRRFFRPSSGAHILIYSFLQTLYMFQAVPPLAAVLVDNTWSCMYSYVSMMMGGGTAWKMYSVCRSK